MPSNTRTRPREREMTGSDAEYKKLVNGLIQWIRQYETRDDEFSFTRHQAIFELFDGAKREFTKLPDPPPAPIMTERLELVATTIELVRAEIGDRDQLAELLSADVPKTWPPELHDIDSMTWTLQRLLELSEHSGWWGRYIVLREDSARTLIGLCGFKGPPTGDGTAELGYGLLREYQKRGFATEAVDGLIRFAFEQPKVSAVRAKTLLELSPSIAVLERCNFTFVGTGSEPGTIAYERDRDD